MAALKKSLGQEPEETAQEGGESHEAKASRGGSGSNQTFAQAGLIGFCLPAMHPDQATVFFQADNAVDLGLADQVADLVMAEPAFRALEADYHRGLLRVMGCLVG